MKLELIQPHYSATVYCDSIMFRGSHLIVQFNDKTSFYEVDDMTFIQVSGKEDADVCKQKDSDAKEKR